MSAKPSKDDLKKAVKAVFAKYDRNNNGLLQVDEVGNLINDALKQMNQNRTVSNKQVEQFIEQVDSNKDKSINEQELLQVFGKVIDMDK